MGLKESRTIPCIRRHYSDTGLPLHRHSPPIKCYSHHQILAMGKNGGIPSSGGGTDIREGRRATKKRPYNKRSALGTRWGQCSRARGPHVS